jgi:hypothetical protein
MEAIQIAAQFFKVITRRNSQVLIRRRVIVELTCPKTWDHCQVEGGPCRIKSPLQGA